MNIAASRIRIIQGLLRIFTYCIEDNFLTGTEFPNRQSNLRFITDIAGHAFILVVNPSIPGLNFAADGNAN